MLYVDDILLDNNNIAFLHSTKNYLTKHFKIKDHGNASLILGIQILQDQSQGILVYHERAILIRF